MADESIETESTADKSLLLDELDEKFAAFQVFRKSDTAAADDLLGSLGAQDDVDKDIVLELSSARPWDSPGSSCGAPPSPAAAFSSLSTVR